MGRLSKERFSVHHSFYPASRQCAEVRMPSEWTTTTTPSPSASWMTPSVAYPPGRERQRVKRVKVSVPG
ncbi:hypothetical protein TNCV_1474431 [Trichonephila clavipes]|nr:hypothetical protein TNCV_1474431 [Trichonephila clavipes]